MTTIFDLSQPSDRSSALTEIIQREITQHHGQISFARFMELALYHPDFGYYNTPHFAIGKQGDFTTAPEISPLFAQCFARQAEEIFAELGSRNVLEIGAGSGRFAFDFLTAMKEVDHYFIYEISSSLRERQQTLLREMGGDFYDRIIWLDSLPRDFVGVIIANEVLDALPVHTFRIENQQIKERLVTWENSEFHWKIAEPESAQLVELVEKIREECELHEGYESEININLKAFLQSVIASLQQGVILFADYGYGRAEYYHPRRNVGTLTCFYQHQRHSNPFLQVGLQDITAHVDFTSVIEYADSYGCILAGYTTQAAFLMNCGLVELTEQAEKHLSEAEKFNLHHGIKLLTFPNEMGEVIKVMGLSKNFTSPLMGFAKLDRSREL